MPQDQLTSAELATILAALRLWQQTVGDLRNALPTELREHFTDTEPLGLSDIDDLCERLNFGKVVIHG